MLFHRNIYLRHREEGFHADVIVYILAHLHAALRTEEKNATCELCQGS